MERAKAIPEAYFQKFQHVARRRPQMPGKFAASRSISVRVISGHGPGDFRRSLDARAYRCGLTMSGRAWSAAGVIGLGRAILAALLALALLSPAVAQQASYNYEIPSGQFKRVRIINVSEGTVLAGLLKPDGPSDVPLAPLGAGGPTHPRRGAPRPR